MNLIKKLLLGLVSVSFPISAMALSFEETRILADQRNAEAQFSLGYMYDFGEGVSQNYDKAFEWYSKAANQGHIEAQFYLGLIYDNGKGII